MPPLGQDRGDPRSDAAQLRQVVRRRLLLGGLRRCLLGCGLRGLLVVLHEALPIATRREGRLHRPGPHIGRGHHVPVVERAPDLRLVGIGECRVGRDPGSRQRLAGLRPDAHQLAQVFGCGSRRGGGSGRDRSLGGGRFGLLRDFDFVVLDDLGATELLGRRHDERHERRRRRGGQRAVDEEGLLGRDGLLDHPDRVGPVPLVQDEQGALALVDFLRHLAHELVIDADVVEAVAQAVQDAAGRAADDRAGRAEDERSDDDTERTATGEALRAAEVGGLMDLDPAEPRPVSDGRVDDLDIGIDVVDLLDPLQQLTRLLALVEHEHGEGLSIVFAHRSSLLSSRDGGMHAGGDARSPSVTRAVGCRSRRDMGVRGPVRASDDDG